MSQPSDDAAPGMTDRFFTSPLLWIVTVCGFGSMSLSMTGLVAVFVHLIT